MSCDLAVWHSKKRLTDAEALEIYHALCDGDTADVEPHPSVPAFLSELNLHYPDIDTIPDAQIDSSPWSVGFDASDAHVLMCIVWSRAAELVTFIERLAEKHRLVCFDPQNSVILTQTFS